jgi:hypothetical protein
VVELDPSAGFELDAVASGGSVEFDVPVTVQGRVSESAVRGTIGAGGETLRIRSSGGGIRIRSR